MRSLTAAGIIAAVLLACFLPVKATAAQYVQITEPFINVYERLDPKSNVLTMAKKGDRLDLIYAGPLWYQVRVQDQIGWVERSAGRVTEGTNVVSILVSIALILAIVGGTLYVVITYINKQKTA
jgi:hypothetical protein